MIRIVSDGTIEGTHFYNENGAELKTLRASCRGVQWMHNAGDLPRALIEVICKVDIVLPKELEVIERSIELPIS